MVQFERIRKLNTIRLEENGPVIYWMRRDQRVKDNWALLTALETAKKDGVPCGVIFSLLPEFRGATLRQYDFMLKGLEEVEKSLKERGVPFFLLKGEYKDTIPKFISDYGVSKIITDFSPLSTRIKEFARNQTIPMWEVDAHNIVPCWIASDKQEFAARTFRPKITKLLEDFLVEFPKVPKNPQTWRDKIPVINWAEIRASINVDRNVMPVNWIEPGTKAAHKIMDTFLTKKVVKYAELRNDPTQDVLSNLSPYLHFGQIAAQRVALEVKIRLNTNPSKNELEGLENFFEELVVRRELSDNYCFYNSNFADFKGFPEWAQKTLDDHRKDPREYTYNLKKFENARTHDELWNAAQKELIQTGKLHGYMRMYWCKKILEWTDSPEEAQKIAIYLNDKYLLDGRDPNGYTGIAWSIGGVHDRAWFERDIYGKVRYMNANGARRKFDVNAYITRWIQNG
ncbi:deoxyribodipyrimidine photo-lyase [Candidatus Dojkabacteria bacterium]|uniref:Deoxyribodipyrimidine photo-lyase n=1 Tax=Candidatus Dojkabacteria bacterium TaxID=2099670 RepID=A0A955L7Z6_9BACT|nr:deoxyribodipyrimidine photo-lyase [Candidatus Dojkabacteria bacterium]